jgi:methylenetetrahydrofolate dehydrogenase (NADP+)/methenyltetrahydrofolate cyclohydrolase
MTALLLRGVEIAARLRPEILASGRLLAERGGHAPRLATLMVGDSPAAGAYRDSIERTMRRVEIEHRPYELPADTSPGRLVETIARLNADPEITGILVLMPLPPPLTPDLVLEHLSPLKDVDGITPTNAGRLHIGLPSLRPSTPAGGLEILDHYGLDPRGLDAVVVGRSNVVGRPLATMLTQRHATVTLCHRQTRHLADLTRRADLVALGAGHAGLLHGEMVKPGAIVLDFGVNVIDDRIVGDADADSVAAVAGYLTPVPGGTGPVTALALARNTIAAGFASLSGNLDDVVRVAIIPPEAQPSS